MNSHRPADPRDLTKPITAIAIHNQRPPSGQGMLVQIDGVTHQFFYEPRTDRAERFARIFDAEVGWMEGFTKHAPSIGSHYENILRSILQEYLPGSLSVGTGFVYDSTHAACSPQMDIIVYSDREKSPIYRRGEFLIVDATDVRAISEVKKRLTLRDVSSLIRKTIGQSLGSSSLHPFGVQQMNLFAISSTASTKAIAERVFQEVRDFLTNFAAVTHEGSLCHIGIMQMCVPHVFLRDRDEYVTVGVQQATDLTGRVSVAICSGAGTSGISPYLSSMNPSLGRDPGHRDFVSPFLVNVSAEFPIEVPLFLVRYLSSAEMVEHFSDWREFLTKSGPTGQRIGATVSSFTELRAYKSLRALSKAPGFKWQYWVGKQTAPAPPGEHAPPTHGKPAGDAW